MANRNQTYDPMMSTTGGMSEMDPEQTKGVMQDILRQKIAGTLDENAWTAPGPWLPDSDQPMPGFRRIRGYDLPKGEEFSLDPRDTEDPKAAMAFWEMQNAWQKYNREEGGHPEPLYLTQANRTIAEQLEAHGKEDTPENREWARGMTHVLGQGFDINQFNSGTGLKDYRGARHQWMRENAARFGFHWPGYQEKKAVRASGVPRPGFTPVPGAPGYERRPEWWHWNYNPVKAAEGHAPIPEWSKVKEAPPVAAAAGATSSIGT